MISLSYTDFLLQEFLHYAVGGILIFIASVVAAVKSYGVAGLIAGSVSCLCLLKCESLPVQQMRKQEGRIGDVTSYAGGVACAILLKVLIHYTYYFTDTVIHITLQVFGFIATFLIAISIWTSYKVTCGSQPTGESDPVVPSYNL